jgi:hypothetical protein
VIGNRYGADGGTETLRPGLVLACPSGRVRVVVLEGATRAPQLAADGIPLIPAAPIACSERPRGPRGLGLIAGARYRDEHSGIEVRCLVSDGQLLTVDGRPMELPSVSRSA